jgi:HK97 family phage prohead protease
MTMTKTLDFNLEIKAADEDEWTFEGLASPFNGPADSYGDVVIPGAYTDTLAKHFRNGTMPVMLWAHDPAEPIGVWEKFHEEGRGLYGRGRLLKGVRRAEEAYILLKNKAIRGLSIGYRVVEAEPDGPINRLRKIDLHEVSIVAIAAAPRARVTEVKHTDNYALLRARYLAGELPSDREFEKGMRDAFGLSNAQAERVVRLYRKGPALGEPGNEPNDDNTALAVALLRDALKGFPDFRRI